MCPTAWENVTLSPPLVEVSVCDHRPSRHKDRTVGGLDSSLSSQLVIHGRGGGVKNKNEFYLYFY